LPKINGLEVLQQIRSDERLKMIPVVVLTSSQEEKDLVGSYALGVNAYVVKPVDFQGFINAVKELGVFWAIINEPPPGSLRTSRRVHRSASSRSKTTRPAGSCSGLSCGLTVWSAPPWGCRRGRSPPPRCRAATST